jgi:hypothetical protein
MADNKIMSKYQKLRQEFSQDKNYNPDVQDNAVYRTKNKADYERKKLEKQQTLWFKGQWQKVKTHITNKALVYETQRYPSYIDYDLMEQYPIIGAALDVLMEESTTTNAEGKILNIYSESKRVQEELKELFYNRLNIHTNLPMWIRNMCKYGDNFVYLQIDDEKGIIGGKQLPNIDVERIEGDATNRMRTYLQQDEDEVIFRWKSTDVAEFKFYQIAHFRLLADDRRLPYGVSVLEKGRRIWKNLLLVEDAMRTIRLLRAIDRRVYYINVGNVDPNDVQAYVEDIASRFKRKRHVDPSTGQEDLKYNVIGYDQDYFIPIRDKDDGTRIDTIQGSSNLDQIADIEYDLNQLFAALGIPKPFLQFEDTAGEGKNLSLQDIRFARKINRIQQAALHELNKIALIHLFLIGLEDDMNNFELTLNNPSTQSDMLRQELLATKISTFRDAVSDANGHGVAAMSVTMAMKEILGMTDDEIKLNLEQQFLERAAGMEMENAGEVISNSTMFDRVIALYGDESLGKPKPEGEGEEGTGGEGGFGGGGGGGFGSDLGGEEDIDLGGEEELGAEEGDLGGEDLGADLGAEEGGEAETGGEETAGAEPELGESFNLHKREKLLEENVGERVSEILKIINSTH